MEQAEHFTYKNLKEFVLGMLIGVNLKIKAPWFRNIKTTDK